MGSPAEPKKRPWVRGLGRLLSPSQEMVDSFSEELAGAQFAAPPYSAYCARDSAQLSQRIDDPSRTRAWEAEKSRQRRYDQSSPCVNAAQWVLYPLRYLFAGEH